MELVSAILLCVATYILAWLLVIRLPKAIKWGYSRGFPKAPSVILATATISRDLVPRLSGYVGQGDVLHIVGSGYYAHGPDGPFWLRSLAAWSKAGVTIHYVMIDPDYQGQRLLKTLTANERFRLYQPSGEKSGDLLSRYAEFHPLLLERANGERVMWIEHRHPRDSYLAFNAEFVAPRDAGTDPRFDQYLHDLEALQADTPIARAEQQAA